MLRKLWMPTKVGYQSLVGMHMLFACARCSLLKEGSNLRGLSNSLNACFGITYRLRPTRNETTHHSSRWQQRISCWLSQPSFVSINMFKLGYRSVWVLIKLCAPDHPQDFSWCCLRIVFRQRKCLKQPKMSIWKDILLSWVWCREKERLRAELTLVIRIRPRRSYISPKMLFYMDLKINWMRTNILYILELSYSMSLLVRVGCFAHNTFHVW